MVKRVLGFFLLAFIINCTTLSGIYLFAQEQNYSLSGSGLKAEEDFDIDIAQIEEFNNVLKNITPAELNDIESSSKGMSWPEKAQLLWTYIKLKAGRVKEHLVYYRTGYLIATSCAVIVGGVVYFLYKIYKGGHEGERKP
jgi:hypothetical protein